MSGAIVSIAADGTVTEISTGNSASQIDRTEGLEYYDGILIPDFVNAHGHSELSYLKGAIEPQGGFAAFAEGLAAVRHNFDLQARCKATDEAFARMWRDGTGAAGDVCNGTDSFETKRHSPLRTISFLELFGLATESVAVLDKVVEAARQASLRYGITPHAIYSLYGETFLQAVQATPDQPLSIHFLETREENQLFEGRGKLADWYRKRGWQFGSSRYHSPVEKLTALVPPERPVLLIHGCAATDSDVEQIAAHFGPNATWVICPCSNRYISNLTPPIDVLRRHSCRIAVGTDSLASNTQLSMIEELKAIEGVPLAEKLVWATENGADALAMNDVGLFEVGRRSGAVVIDNIDWQTESLTSRSTSRRIV